MSETASVEPTGKRERAKAANREAILVAARRVFAQLGYDAATVRDVIRGTDLASGTFYNYFRSKEEVYEALVDDGARRFKPILRAAHENAATFEEYLRNAIAAYFHFIVEDNAIEGKPIGERQPHVRPDAPEMISIYQEVRHSIEDATNKGLLPRIDSDYLACACIGIAQEVGAAMLRRTPLDVDAAASFAASLILRGLDSTPRKA